MSAATLRRKTKHLDGASVRDFVVEVMKRRKHPEQAFRSCFGLMRLAKEFGSQRLDAACLRALTLGAFRYKSVKSILEKGLDSRPLPSDARRKKVNPAEHLLQQQNAGFKTLLHKSAPKTSRPELSVAQAAVGLSRFDTTDNRIYPRFIK